MSRRERLGPLIAASKSLAARMSMPTIDAIKTALYDKVVAASRNRRAFQEALKQEVSLQ
jgi:hypothetical protein